EQHRDRGHRVPDADGGVVDVGPAQEYAARRRPNVPEARFLRGANAGVVLVGRRRGAHQSSSVRYSAIASASSAGMRNAGISAPGFTARGSRMKRLVAATLIGSVPAASVVRAP